MEAQYVVIDHICPNFVYSILKNQLMKAFFENPHPLP